MINWGQPLTATSHPAQTTGGNGTVIGAHGQRAGATKPVPP